MRSSSTSYKLKISNGDIKSVQADTGHAQAKMVADTYARIQDRPRRELLEKVEENFYADEKTPAETTDKTLESLLKNSSGDTLKNF